MIQAATEADIPRALGRRKFLSMLVGGAASAVAPTKTFAFFGNILRRSEPTIPPLPTSMPMPMAALGPQWWVPLVIGGAAMMMGALVLGPDVTTPEGQEKLQSLMRTIDAKLNSEALSRLREAFPVGEVHL